MKDGIFKVTIEDGTVKEYKLLAVVDDEEKYIIAMETGLLVNNNFLEYPCLSMFSLIDDGDNFLIGPVKNQERALEVKNMFLKESVSQFLASEE